MEKLKRFFGAYSMTWPKVLIFAVITAVYTALINEIPFLYDTSFQDIAITFECWILFAVWIIVNCDKWWEASLKCFVFFLISQPLIYLIEVPFEPLGWGVFQYYGYWFALTVLTVPGAAIAHQIKRKNWLSVAVLSVATGYLAYACVEYFAKTIYAFPHHLLSGIFCIGLAVFFVFVLLDEKKHRIAALAVIGIVLVASIALLSTKVNRHQELSLGDGTWHISAVEDRSIADVEMTDDQHVSVTAQNEGMTLATFEKEDGTQCQYYITVSGGSVYVSLLN